ncbi:MAG: NAD(P)H-dependent oxidoreductase [Thermogutta sp.]|uniref:NADPH-dependent FMN reductase n=1 Tax=Thermogutta sp. TaxID=1962930 RepID=UPI00199D8091|nr:NAD(P)H-dependent oxidoreductase [Thermogutta sp.]MBC7351321.1 NAD(P)H-dependent oxidoreductase [Thermogutta sp.]GIX02845.1 MAG: flavoprotein [Thermogutta sp.]
MKIGIISGSHRPQGESHRVARYVKEQLRELGVAETYLLNLADTPFPFWDEGVWSGSDKWAQLLQPVMVQLRACEGFVVISPEWSGMVPAALKNFFLLCDKEVLAHKPGLIITVSASLGGSYPVAELRLSSYKNTRICYIPEHVIIRNVSRMLHGEAPASPEDATIRQRLRYSLKLLIEYAKALRAVRQSGVVDLETYPYGM